MSAGYLVLEDAARQSGLHPNSLRRLLRQGVILGYKAKLDGRQRWLVSAASLKHYTDPVVGFLLDLPGPKMFLRRNNVDDDNSTDS